jgi:hypothetical protein
MTGELENLIDFDATLVCKMLQVSMLQRFERIYFVEIGFFSTISVEI